MVRIDWETLFELFYAYANIKAINNNNNNNNNNNSDS
jgi:hypothetical protein